MESRDQNSEISLQACQFIPLSQVYAVYTASVVMQSEAFRLACRVSPLGDVLMKNTRIYCFYAQRKSNAGSMLDCGKNNNCFAQTVVF